MTELSPAAQAVLNASYEELDYVPQRHVRWAVAAALRAAADQAENVHPVNASTEWGEGWLEGVQDVVAGFRRIATELENA